MKLYQKQPTSQTSKVFYKLIKRHPNNINWSSSSVLYCRQLWICFCLLGYFQKQPLWEINNSILTFQFSKVIYMAQFLYSSFLFYLYQKPETFRKDIPAKISLFESSAWKISPDITIKASIETILVILLLTLKNFLSAEINFWKTPSRRTFKTLGSFQVKYLWRSFFLVKPLSLRFTAILLKLMIQ